MSNGAPMGTSARASSPTASFALLGQVTIEGESGARVEIRGAQPALVLGFLALERPRPLLRDELFELLWPDRLPGHFEGVARQVLSRARRALVDAGLAADVLTSDAGATRLDPRLVVDVDVEAAVEDVLGAERSLAAGAPRDAATLAARAVPVLRQPFLPRADGHWVLAWRRRVDAYLQRALIAGAGAAIGDDRSAEAIELATNAMERDVFDERATRVLMAAEERSGNRAGALAAYEQLRRRLDDELGVRPSEETEEAHRALLGAAPEPPRPATSTTDAPPDESTRFVGRRAELDTFDEQRRSAARAVGRLVVVEGEAGIGKTRLVREVASRAVDDGALVLWGRCGPRLGVAHGPFVDIVGQLLSQRPDVVDRLGPLAAHLGPLVPGVVPRADDATPVSSDQVTARLFRAVSSALVAADDRPVVVVVDDVHWADDDTLLLLQHVADRLSHHRVLLVLALRAATPAVAHSLAELSRLLPTTTVSLGGLTVDDVATLLRESDLELGDAGSAASTVAARTAGNPLYVTQLIREAEGSGLVFDPTSVPTAVARLLERRLAALDDDLAAVLVLAAVAGNEFALPSLEACAAVPADEVLDRVEELCRLRFLEERGSARFAFVHELVRDAVLATVGTTRRERLHRRIADGLAGERGDPSTVAGHYLAAGDACLDATVRWSLLAGDEALTRAAWSGAAEHFDIAVERATTTEDRCDALIGLGRAQRALGHTEQARKTLDTALALATAHGLHRRVAAATLSLVGGGGRGVAVDLRDQEREALLGAALTGLTDADQDLVVGVLAELALSLVLTAAIDDRVALCERSLAVARAADDPRLLATALWARRVALMGPAGTRDRLADGREAAALRRDVVPAELGVAVQLGLVEDLLELGERAAADAALQTAHTLATELDHPYWSWATACWRTLAAIIDCDLTRAEDLALEAVALQPGEHPEAVAALGVNLVNIRLLQGRADEVLDLLTTAADENPQIPCYRAVLSLCCAAAGDLDLARVAFDCFARDDFAIPTDSNWLLTTSALADVAATLEDVDAATTLGALLEPFADRQVVLNCYGGGGAWWGPVAHHLGRLALVLGAPDAARGYFADAERCSARLGADWAAASSRELLASVADIGSNARAS